LIRHGLLILAALSGLMLPGCTLIDQNTFNPAASTAPVIPRAPAPPVAAGPPGPPALLTLRLGQPYQDAVRQAVAAARRLKQGVVFDVVAVVPAEAAADTGPGSQAASSSAEAGAVARAITAQGVPPRQVRLLARPDAGVSARETRVYVR